MSASRPLHKYVEIHANTRQYTEIHGNTRQYTPIHGNTQEDTERPCYTQDIDKQSNPTMSSSHTLNIDEIAKYKIIKVDLQ